MCGTAEEIQQMWPTVWRDENDCCEKGKYEDGSSKQLHLEGLKIEERKKLLNKNYWIPNGLQLRTRSLFNNTLNGKMPFLSKDPQDCLLDKRMAGKVKGYFVGEEINSALTLMSFMKERFQKRWDFKHENWVKIASPG
jgi:hypothetical protein